jgi:hypothetical protein
LATTGSYIEYTSLKVPVTREMAEALAGHLRRNKTGGRIIRIPSGEVVDEWLAEPQD